MVCDGRNVATLKTACLADPIRHLVESVSDAAAPDDVAVDDVAVDDAGPDDVAVDGECVVPPVPPLYAAWAHAQARDLAGMPPEFSCPSDCALCCERSPAIAVTPAEAVLAAAAVKALPSALGLRVRAQLRTLSGLVETDGAVRLDGAGDGIHGACPLLDGGRCSIYAARPLICRAFGFAALADGSYFGCEVLAPVVRGFGDFTLPSMDAARSLLPDVDVLDASGKALPRLGMLAELVDRLLD